jgi:hypothetical protein
LPLEKLRLRIECEATADANPQMIVSHPFYVQVKDCENSFSFNSLVSTLDWVQSLEALTPNPDLKLSQMLPQYRYTDTGEASDYCVFSQCLFLDMLGNVLITRSINGNEVPWLDFYTLVGDEQTVDNLAVMVD